GVGLRARGSHLEVLRLEGKVTMVVMTVDVHPVPARREPDMCYDTPHTRLQWQMRSDIMVPRVPVVEALVPDALGRNRPLHPQSLRVAVPHAETRRKRR